ncbi:MAG: hypothetical protein CMI68_00715 [Candidatus Pelagibacter sp.]|nr:hypothetical protein [Candidatus Pelagibacter sp.]
MFILTLYNYTTSIINFFINLSHYVLGCSDVMLFLEKQNVNKTIRLIKDNVNRCKKLEFLLYFY